MGVITYWRRAWAEERRRYAPPLLWTVRFARIAAVLGLLLFFPSRAGLVATTVGLPGLLYGIYALLGRRSITLAALTLVACLLAAMLEFAALDLLQLPEGRNVLGWRV